MEMLITGAAGVLGSAVGRALGGHDAAVTGVGRRAAPADFAGAWSIADVRVPGALDPLLGDVSTIVHCATNAMKPSDDLIAVDNVVASAVAARCHLVFVSIAGIEDAAAGYAYYGAKLTAEARIAASGAAHTIVRIAQFHDLVDFIFGSLAIGPLFLRPAWTLQPVDAAFAGECVARLAVRRPAGRVADVLGPQRLAGDALVAPWLAANNKRVLQLPAPPVGPIRALGRLRDVEGERGGRTWRAWLASRTGPSVAYRPRRD